MHLGLGVKQERAEKALYKAGPLLPQEEAWCYVKCNNLRPMLDAVIVTNQRLLGLSTSDYKFKFRALTTQIAHIEGDRARGTVSVAATDGQQLTFKMMKSEDVDAVQHYVSYARETPPSQGTVAAAIAAGGSTVRDHSAPATSHHPAGEATSVTTVRPWWQSWWAIFPGLLLCFPIGLIALWLRRGISNGTKTGVSIAALLLVVVALANSPSDEDETPAASTPTESSSPSATAKPSPTSARVPAMDGIDISRAKEKLRKAGLKAGPITRKPAVAQRGTVLAQAVKAGATVKLGTSVALVIAVPLPRVPAVVGQAAASATSELRRAGYRVRTTYRTEPSGLNRAVITQSPRKGVRAREGTLITIVVRKVVAPPPPPSPRPLANNCSDGYSPCLPPASDYDCAGGEGDGPRYAEGPVRITGSDPYDLDTDDDGIACED